MADKSFIENLNLVAEKLGVIEETNGLFDKETVDALDSLSGLDIVTIIEDLKKGSYLGARKIDIDLTLNNQSDVTPVTYSEATLTLDDGSQIAIPFLQDLAVLELSSHADIKSYIVTHAGYIANVTNTEATVEEAIGDSPTLIRFRDADGVVSNLDRVELQTYSGSFNEAIPAYFWAKSTSSLQALSNRSGDIVALGENIENIIALADKEIEIQHLYDVRVNLQSLYDNLSEIIDVEANLVAIGSVNDNQININAVDANETNIIAANANKTNIDKVAINEANIIAVALNEADIDAVAGNQVNINAVNTNKTNIDSLATNMQDILDAPTHAQTATDKATEAGGYASDAMGYRDELTALDVQAVQLVSSATAYTSYDSNNGILTIGIPQGLKGDIGEAFTVDATGTLAGRDSYDGASAGFSYLTVDEDPTKIYFKASDTSGDWSVGVPFGKGDTGDTGLAGNGISTVIRTAGDGSAGTTDTYTITFTDTSTSTFDVYNGADSTLLSVAGRTGDVVLVNSDVGLGNVDNTSDANKPISTATQDALDNKEAADATILKNASIGVTIQAYDENAVSDASYVHTDNNYTTTEKNKLAGIEDSATSDQTGAEIKAAYEAEADTNAFSDAEKSKLLGLTPDALFQKPSVSVLFTKTAPASFTLPIGFKVVVGSVAVELTSDYTLDLNTDLDTGSKTAGSDYYVYAKSDSSFYISLDDSITADRLIGGFHYSLIPEAETTTGNKTESDMVAIRGINAHSFWDLKFRPISSPKGMVYIGGRWYDIYLLNSEHITNGTSKAGATIAAGATDNGRAIPKIPLEYGGDGSVTYGKFTWFQACEIAKAHSKQLINYAEFPTIAYGVTEGDDSDAVDGGLANIEHYDYLTSKYGIEQATGVEWVWGKDLANGYGTTDFAWKDNADARGQIYSTSNAPVAVLLGGNRGYGVYAGSRASSWDRYVWNSVWSLGCRFACDHLELV